MGKRKWISVILSALFAASLTACGGGATQTTGQDSGQAAESKKETAVNENASAIVGIKSAVLTLDPANHRDRVTESVLRNIFDGLVTRDENGDVQAQIAESWENPSPTEWVFKLRQGVKFHDMSDVTADDVVFTFQRIIKEKAMGGETSPRKGLLGPVTEVQKIDDYTVKFILSEPWPILLKMLPHQQIVPKAYIEKVGDEQFRQKPIGAGPFKLVEAKLDERIVLERFDDYYRGAPQIKNLAFDVIPETSSRVAALQSGEVHRIHSLSPTLVPQLQNDSNIEVKMVDGTRVYMVEMNVQKPPFDQVKVRQAMNHAVDMDLIIKTILGGNAKRLAGPMLQNAFGINQDLKPYEYNPEKAKKLLAEAGYANGFPLVIDTNADNKEIAEAIAAQLRKIGVAASTRVWDRGVLTDMLLKGERQMSMGDWGNATHDPYDFLNPKLKTKDRGNYSLYSNPRVDELLEKGAVELDEAKRKELYREAQQIIYDDAPWIFGYQMSEIEAGLKQLQGWAPSPDGMLDMSKTTMSK